MQKFFASITKIHKILVNDCEKRFKRRLIRGERAGYSTRFFEARGGEIFQKASGKFVDFVKGAVR